MNVFNMLKITAQYLLPKHAVSRLVGRLAAAQAGALTTWLIKVFMKRFGISLAEAERERPEDYVTFNDFFTRTLKAGVRPIVAEPNAVALPVDGCVSQIGDIQHGRIIQAKGHDFSARELLGGDDDLSELFQNGKFATIYLSPKDYHRIHMPLDGEVRNMVYIPGDLFSVNPLTAANVPNLFARNERVACVFHTPFGPMAMVLVGATIVASIETVWAGTVTPPAGKMIKRWDFHGSDPIILKKGDEMGLFKLGSTVVCLFPPKMIEFIESLQPGSPTKMGELFAYLLPH
jgi:phosphatidylserine decarboxylase